MGKIINKRHAQPYITLDRAFIRDTRLEPTSKLIYGVLCALSESCENVYPSYGWLAEQIGYKYKGKHEVESPEYERAMKKYICENLQPLIDLNLIKKVENPGLTCDYEVHSYHEPTGTPPVNPQVHGNHEPTGTPNKQSSKQSEVVEEFIDNELFEKVQECLLQNLPYLAMYKLLSQIVATIAENAGEDYEEYILYVKDKKADKNKLFTSPKAWGEWFYQDWFGNRALVKFTLPKKEEWELNGWKNRKDWVYYEEFFTAEEYYSYTPEELAEQIEIRSKR